MKTRITMAMIIFIGFVLCSAAVAYYPVLIVRECPHCRAHVAHEFSLFTVGTLLEFGRSIPRPDAPSGPSRPCPPGRAAHPTMKSFRRWGVGQ